MPLPDLSVDEIIQTLKRSSLPTVLCEGRRDLSVLRCLEDVLDPRRVSFLPCGGRVALLAVFDRRSEVPRSVAFFADKDTWVFTGVPAKYRGIVFTWGYSIENDLLEGARVDRLLTREERQRFQAALKEIIRWYAFEISKLPATPSVDVHVTRLLQPDREELSNEFLAFISFSEPPPELINQITTSYQQLLRGKTWVQLLVRFLSHRSRESKYQDINLLEMAVRLFSNKRVNNLLLRITRKLELQRPAETSGQESEAAEAQSDLTVPARF